MSLNTRVSVQILMALALTGILHAESANQRITLALSGQNCSAYHQMIAQRLSRIAGVKRIDLQLIPDHLLIDRTQDMLAAEDFAVIVNEVLPAVGECHADVMQSCISADIPRHASAGSR